MDNQESFYQMPAFVTLSVRNLAASTEWYQKVFGFKLVFQMPNHEGIPIFSHLRFSKYADVMLAQESTAINPDVKKGVGASFAFSVFAGTVDEIAEAAKANGADILPVTIKPWNAREFTVTDPDGYKITFTQPIANELTIDDVIKNVAKEV